MSNTSRPFTIDIPNNEVLATAIQFRKTAELLCTDLVQNQLVIPFMVNCALALELYLKALNSKNVHYPIEDDLPLSKGYAIFSEPVTKKHELTKVFDDLFSEIQAELSAVYATTPVVPQAAGIRDALLAFDNLFTRQRYWFEQRNHSSGNSLTALFELVSVVGNYVERLQPRQLVSSE